jgi:hypothetical protein
MSTDLHDQSENAGRLGEVLSEWVVDAPLPPHFQARVWQRIAQAERQADFTVWDAILRRAQALLTRPKIALACGTVFLALGVAAGSWMAQLESNRVNQNLGKRSIQAVDPYYSLQRVLEGLHR